MVVLFVLAALVGLNVVPRWVGSAATATALAVVLVVLTRGIVRLVRDRGVTLQAVAGALTTYLLIGLEFALIVRVIVGLSPHPYFEQVTNAAVTQSQEIYFSFTTLTTTGYGDLSPVLSVGRALSVLEMLFGQIYLVTVIGLLVGNLRRELRARAGDVRGSRLPVRSSPTPVHVPVVLDRAATPLRPPPPSSSPPGLRSQSASCWPTELIDSPASRKASRKRSE